MTRTLMVALTALLVLLLPAAVAAEPAHDVTDACGVTDRSDRTALPWQDLCSADLATAFDEDSGVTTVTVTMTLDGDVALRTPTSYEAILSDGTCQYWLMHEDAEGIRAADDRVQVRCGRGESVPCDPPVLEDLGFFCFTLPDPTFHELSFSEAGRTVTMQFATDGSEELPLTEGDVIDQFAVATAAQVAGEGSWGSSCGLDGDGEPHDCTSDTGDHAYRRHLGHEVQRPS